MNSPQSEAPKLQLTAAHAHRLCMKCKVALPPSGGYQYLCKVCRELQRNAKKLNRKRWKK